MILPRCICDIRWVFIVAGAATAPDVSADGLFHSAGFLAGLSGTFGFDGGSMGLPKIVHEFFFNKFLYFFLPRVAIHSADY